MSDVRDLLENALSDSAQRGYLIYHWRRRLHVNGNAEEEMYLDSDLDSGSVSPIYIDKILANYTEREIITILAAARLEGVWTPE